MMYPFFIKVIRNDILRLKYIETQVYIVHSYVIIYIHVSKYSLYVVVVGNQTKAQNTFKCVQETTLHRGTTFRGKQFSTLITYYFMLL